LIVCVNILYIYIICIYLKVAVIVVAVVAVAVATCVRRLRFHNSRSGSSGKTTHTERQVSVKQQNTLT